MSTLSWRSLTRKFAPKPPPTTRTTTPSLSFLFTFSSPHPFCPPNSSCPKRHLHPMQHKLVSACFEASSNCWSLPFLLLAPLHSNCFEKGRKKGRREFGPASVSTSYHISRGKCFSFSFSFCSPYLGFWLTLFVFFCLLLCFCVSCFFHSLRACLKL